MGKNFKIILDENLGEFTAWTLALFGDNAEPHTRSVEHHCRGTQLKVSKEISLVEKHSFGS